MQWLTRYRLLCWLAAAAVVGLLGFGYFLQYVKNLEPCPLCIVQRIAFLLVGIAFVVGALLNPAGTGRKILGSVSLLLSLAGIALASRQLWLQSLPPDQVPGCGFGLDYMLEVFPLWEVFLTMVQGTGDCAEIQWRFLGLTIPGWSLLAFSGFAVLSLWLILMRSKASRD
jgi:disulfide bond formation protein DsbB